MIMATFRNDNANERERDEAATLAGDYVYVSVRGGKYGRKYTAGCYDVTVDVDTSKMDGLIALKQIRPTLRKLNLKMQ